MANGILPACRTADGLEYEYREYLWGDVIDGSKEVLQRMGIGTGIGFPGEHGHNKRKVSTTDPRGFPCVITVCYSWSKFPFSVHISHPGRHYPDPDDDWKEVFPGVQCQSCTMVNIYKGTADALTLAGIVPAGMFPGMPGMRSGRVTILADGTLPTSHKNSVASRCTEGVMTIEKSGKCSYQVVVKIANELEEKRYKVGRAHRMAWEARMAAMPRAPRIDLNIRNKINEQANKKRAELRVVWSRPKFVPKFNLPTQGPFSP